VTFKGLARSTVEGWIDCSGKLKWTEAAIQMANLDNHQGHSNGGKKEIFIRAINTACLE
jgi:hypothetical protein